MPEAVTLTTLVFHCIAVLVIMVTVFGFYIWDRYSIVRIKELKGPGSN